MKTMKRMLSLLTCMVMLLAVMSLGVSAEGNAEDSLLSATPEFTDVLAEAKEGIVQIYCLSRDDYYIYSSTGTGFAVGEYGEDSDVFVTNWHVIAPEEGAELLGLWILQENCKISEETWEPDPSNSIEIEVLKTTDGHPDYAIVQAIEECEGYKPLKLMESSDDVPDGTKVYALGYPADVGNATVNHYGIDDITSTDGMISQHMQYAYEENTWCIMHTAVISHGNSGGPLITEDGYVIGINTYGFNEDADRYCAVYIDYAIEGLDDLDLEYTLADPDEINLDDLLPILLVAGLILVVGAVAVLILRQKKQEEEHRRREDQLRSEQRQREEQMRAEQRQMGDQMRAEQQQFREEQQRREAALRAETAAAVAAAARAGAASQASGGARPQSGDRTVRGRVQFNGGAYYPIYASGSVIGRDRSCEIALPENTSGVSRRHCKLEYRGDRLLLTDLNSTYGVFIHQKRIPANVPVEIKPGVKFSLGSENCKFTVC